MVDSKLLALSGINLSPYVAEKEKPDNKSTEADDIMEEYEASLGYYSSSPSTDIYTSISHQTIKNVPFALRLEPAELSVLAAKHSSAYDSEATAKEQS